MGHQVLLHIIQFALVPFLALVFQVILKRKTFIIPHTRNISTSCGEGKFDDMEETEPWQSVAIIFALFGFLWIESPLKCTLQTSHPLQQEAYHRWRTHISYQDWGGVRKWNQHFRAASVWNALLLHTAKWDWRLHCALATPKILQLEDCRHQRQMSGDLYLVSS